ncbi:hypothetical protein [Bacillus toyonensis]|uniref:Uncharacterized protein n=1 Tax=Bacillus toyonensis TaxID=155322 RepID=A0A2B5CPA0_9BACI|nr:hypothetical protein [Bacillus toyonensis]PEJ86035.1 hypothetical protein CN688_29575 [Bacillus toyonensis]PEK75028.1 hypothetical protein CN594_31870 [Bacillus toyonensis]PEL17670.1 hypothetical protein CN624_29500 [Bacillus toyonensis]PEO41003.1 hypothetical protein CN579_34635 [Bacillus toyonensis]PFY28827.1 hypothetical protein COL55_33975 [Bacillus toyonensis]
MKKMMRHALLGVTMLTGIAMIGVDSASADTLKDSNGNPIVAGQQYYMQPYEFPGRGLAYAWSTASNWAKLGSSPGEAVTFEQTEGWVRIKTDKWDWKHELLQPVLTSLYLAGNSDGVELRFDNPNHNTQWWTPTEPSSDMNSDFAARNYYAFKNYNNNQFMSYRNAGDWLYVDQSTMNSKTMWRLIKK